LNRPAFLNWGARGRSGGRADLGLAAGSGRADLGLQRARIRASFCCSIDFCLTVFARDATGARGRRSAIASSTPEIAQEPAVDAQTTSGS
jgi:hypothetical protein